MQSIFEHAKRLKAISHLGLTYSNNEYDRERYEELETISLDIMEQLTNEPVSRLSLFFSDTKEYITPKVDIRVVIFNEKEEILLVREKADGLWSLPGGWADIGSSPREVAVKEAFEETGLRVETVKLLAAMDMKCHPHPPQLHYAYKLFIRCKVIDGSWNEVHDILDKGYFAQDALPPLSLERILPQQIDLMFEFLRAPDKETVFD